MTLWKSFLIALSTYSKLPVPQFDWTEKPMRYAICFFPAVGLLCGGALYGWYALCRWLEVGGVLFAAAAVCLPLLVTGGIHMDGYMDTVDALASHQPRERKLEILKDSSCGAFAATCCGVYLLLSAGLLHELYGAGLAAALCPAFFLSRSLSALCAVNLPGARKNGMLRAYTENARKRIVTAAMAAAALLGATGLLLLSPAGGGCALLLSAAVVLAYRQMALRQFGGVTGDTAGFFLQLCELACLTGIWIGGCLL